MVRAFGLYPVAGYRAKPLRGHLLELALEVACPPFHYLVDKLLQRGYDEPASHVEAAVQVKGADHRLERISEYRLLLPAAGAFLAFSQEHVALDAESQRDVSERFAPDQRRAQLGQLSLRQVGEILVQKMSYRKLHNGIPEKFQPLV